jgi:hypothetical protein
MANCGTIVIGTLTLVSTVRSSAEISNIPFGTLREDRDSKFLSAFWTRLFQLVYTELAFTTANHSAADGKLELPELLSIHPVISVEHLEPAPPDPYDRSKPEPGPIHVDGEERYIRGNVGKSDLNLQIDDSDSCTPCRDTKVKGHQSSGAAHPGERPP